MDYITKNFNEFDLAAQIIESGKFPDGGTNKELKLVAKYMRWDIADYYGFDLAEINYWDMKEVSEEIEQEMIKFCEKAIPGFDYYDYCIEISKAVRASELYRMNFGDPTPITLKEWEKIQNIEDENTRKLMFIKLVDAKYYMNHRRRIRTQKYNTSEYFNREQITQTMICREMKINRGQGKTRYKEYWKAWHKLRELGYIEQKEIFQGEDKRSKMLDKVMIVDNDPEAEIVEMITDYEHLILHYERMCGKQIGRCSNCGKLFRQSTTRNKYKYCEKCRNEKKLTKKKTSPKIRQCIDCGEYFDLPLRGNTSQKFRCRSCQDQENKIKKIEWMKNKRVNVETKY